VGRLTIGGNRLLRPTGEVSAGRTFDQRRYACAEALNGQRVLLVDDTWTTGGHSQSAAFALRDAGASSVGLVVIGRHVRPEWEVAGETCGEIMAALPRPFDWTTRAVHP